MCLLRKEKTTVSKFECQIEHNITQLVRSLPLIISLLLKKKKKMASSSLRITDYQDYKPALSEGENF